MRFLRILFFLCLTASFAAARAQGSNPGYDVILLVGQSNMVGYGTIPDNVSDAATNARVSMWDPNTSSIIMAKDPLMMNQEAAYIGMGMTFGKAYIASLAANRKLLLVGSADGGTSFVSGRWQAPDGDLARTAVARANAAMAAAGPGARFAGILWHQGESDLGDSGSTYQNYLLNLFAYFRGNITGATNTTPIVVGEWTYTWQTDNLRSHNQVPSQAAIMQVFHTLPDTLNNTAWVNAGGLASDFFAGDVHFSAISQRQLGRRYADRFFEASIGLPQPETALEPWGGEFFDGGRSYDNNVYPVNFPGEASGAVNVVDDSARGNVVQISGGKGYLTYLVPSATFNGDYTKMAWFKPGAPGYYNNLISGRTRARITTLPHTPALVRRRSWPGTMPARRRPCISGTLSPRHGVHGSTSAWCTAQPRTR